MIKLYHNFIFLFILIFNVRGKENLKKVKKNFTDFIEEGYISRRYLSKEIKLIFRTLYPPILIHILPIDCEIKIDNLYDYHSLDIRKISYYNYDAFSVYSNDENITLKISSLINSSRKENQARNYTLIINQLFNHNPDVPELIIKEDEPAFFYFNDNLKKVKLIYHFVYNNNENPIIVSFFIKEKIAFKIEISFFNFEYSQKKYRKNY